MFNLKNNFYLILLVVTSIILYASLIEEGLFTVDEREYLYLSRAISERFSLDCSPYFKEFATTGSNMALPLGFSGKDGKVYNGVTNRFGFPLLAAPFYKLFGICGLQVFNIMITLLTSVLIFFLSKKIYLNESIAYVAAVLYSFCTFSMFYAVSLWYHSAITFFFILSLTILMYYSEKRTHFLGLFIISSLFCVWVAPYMFFPLFVLLLFFTLEMDNNYKKITLISLFLFILFSPALFISSFHHVPMNLLSRVTGWAPLSDSILVLFSLLLKISYMPFGFIAMFICRGCVSGFDEWAWCQKSILESSPFLIAALPGFIYLYRMGIDSRLKFILSSNLIYILMVIYARTDTFGSWELSMRYLLPVIPLLTIVSSEFISRFLNYRYLFLILVVSTIFSYFSPTLFFNFWYYHLMSLSLYLAALLLLIWVYQRTEGKYKLGVKNEIFVIVTLLISLIFLSNFININDVKIGNEYRLRALIAPKEIETITEPESVVLLPRKSVYERIEIKERIVLYYSGRGYVLFNQDYPNGDPISSIKNTLSQYLERKKSVYVVIRDQGDWGIMKNFDMEYVASFDIPPPTNEIYILKINSHQ